MNEFITRYQLVRESYKNDKINNIYRILVFDGEKIIDKEEIKYNEG